MKKLLLLLILISISWADLSPDILWTVDSFTEYYKIGSGPYGYRHQVESFNDSTLISFHTGEYKYADLILWNLHPGSEPTYKRYPSSIKSLHQLSMVNGNAALSKSTDGSGGYVDTVSIVDSNLTINKFPYYSDTASLGYANYSYNSKFVDNGLGIYTIMYEQVKTGSVRSTCIYMYDYDFNFKWKKKLYDGYWEQYTFDVGADSCLYMFGLIYDSLSESNILKLRKYGTDGELIKATIIDTLKNVSQFDYQECSPLVDTNGIYYGLSAGNKEAIIKISFSGEVLFLAQFYGDRISSLVKTADGGILCGTYYGELIRFDSTGREIWKKSLGGKLYNMKSTNDSTVLIFHDIDKNIVLSELGKEKLLKLKKPVVTDTFSINPFTDSTLDIAWEYSPYMSDSVEISYRLSKDAEWEFIEKTENDGEYEWTLFPFVSKWCDIKVADAANPDLYDTTDTGFSVITPTVRVYAPDSVVTWPDNSIQDVRWHSGVGAVNVLYSLNEGRDWTPFLTNTTSSSYTWTIPQGMDMTKLIVCVQSVKYPFMIDYNRAPANYKSISITKPVNGDIIENRDSLEITWDQTCKAMGYLVDLYLSKDNGISWELIGDKVVNKGAYKWYSPLKVESTECLVKVVDHFDTTYQGVSSQFSIQYNKQDVTVLNPKKGEYFKPGTTMQIKWQMDDPTPRYGVCLYLSIDDGQSWEFIFRASQHPVTNTGQANWTIPAGIESDKCMLKIADEHDTTFNGHSDIFVISETDNLFNSSALKVSNTIARIGMHTTVDLGIPMNRGDVTIFDSRGRILHKSSFRNSRIVIEKEQLFSNGFYVMRVRDSNREVSKRFIIR